jgi:hypothetical protein
MTSVSVRGNVVLTLCHIKDLHALRWTPRVLPNRHRHLKRNVSSKLWLDTMRMKTASLVSHFFSSLLIGLNRLRLSNSFKKR